METDSVNKNANNPENKVESKKENKTTIQQNKAKDKMFTRDDVNKMIASEKKKAVAEYERLAKMSQAERDAENKKKLDAERAKERETFEAEKRAFALEKLKNQTGKELLSKGLSADFAEFLTAQDAKQTKANLDSFEKFFRAEIEKAVQVRLRGETPKTKSTDTAKQSVQSQKKWNRYK